MLQRPFLCFFNIYVKLLFAGTWYDQVVETLYPFGQGYNKVVEALYPFGQGLYFEIWFDICGFVKF